MRDPHPAVHRDRVLDAIARFIVLAAIPLVI